MQEKIILASSSKYRAELLQRLHLEILVQAPAIDENKDIDDTPASWAEILSVRKAKAVAKQHPDALVIGSDQVAEFNNQVIGKPGSRINAINQLMAFSGAKVAFHTGVALVSNQRQILLSALDTTWVHFRHLDRDEVAHYIDIEQPFDCAGSFKCESLGISLFDRVVSDDPTALIGLPLITLCGLLRRVGVDIPGSNCSAQ
jgi:septum formation protein